MILGYPGMHGALVDTESASGVGHGLIRLDGQFDCSLFELGTIRWGFVFAYGRDLTSLADTRLPNCPLQCSHFSPVALIVTFTALYPILSIVLAWLILGETISLCQGVGIVFGLIAMVLIAT